MTANAIRTTDRIVITIRQLRYLQALARHRHFGRAAEVCAVTQPALSMQIRELEKELDVELVERRPGDAALTEIGVEVAKRGDEVLAAVRDLVDFARHSGRLFTGELRLGVIPTLAPYLRRDCCRSCMTAIPTWLSNCARRKPRRSSRSLSPAISTP